MMSDVKKYLDIWTGDIADSAKSEGSILGGH